MKKYWALWAFAALLLCIFFWAFLGSVEDNGKEYALLSILEIVVYGFLALLFLIFSAGYWCGIGMLIDKRFPNLPKWANYIMLVIMGVIYVLLLFKIIDGGKSFKTKYDDYKYQKKFEYERGVEL